MTWINRPTDDSGRRAVTPVIGIILMVAVTVILAAVVSTFVLGVGNEVQSHPMANFGFHYDGTNTLVIDHTGGDDLETSNVHVSISGTSTAWTEPDGSISTGDTATVSVNPGDTVYVVWQGEESTSAVLGSYHVPA